MLLRHAIKEIPVPIQIYLYKRGMIMFSESMETEALILKWISPDDRGFIFRQFSDDAVNRYLFDAEPMQEIREADELIDFYTAPQPRRQQRWILILKDGGEKSGPAASTAGTGMPGAPRSAMTCKAHSGDGGL